MDPSKLRKRQIARRLGVSEQILEQYLQLKRAEVLQPQPAGAEAAAPGGADVLPAGSQGGNPGSGRTYGTVQTRPSRGSRQPRVFPAGQVGERRRD